MKTVKVITNNFDIFDKLSKINLVDNIKIKDSSENRKRLNKIFNNINKNGILIEGVLEGDMISITKRQQDLNLNVYFRTK